MAVIGVDPSRSGHHHFFISSNLSFSLSLCSRFRFPVVLLFVLLAVLKSQSKDAVITHFFTVFRSPYASWFYNILGGIP